MPMVSNIKHCDRVQQMKEEHERGTSQEKTTPKLSSDTAVLGELKAKIKNLEANMTLQSPKIHPSVTIIDDNTATVLLQYQCHREFPLG